MNIGIIVYSQTGHTESVAEKLKERLSAGGHSANIEKLAPIGDVHPGAKDIRYDKLPDINRYDALIFGSPVQGFGLSTAMTTYLPQVPSLNGKKTACFVTQGLPFAWMGARKSISTMEKLCGDKGAKVCGTGIISWAGAKRENQTEALVGDFSKLF